jgi:N-methylhydantoinase A
MSGQRVGVDIGGTFTDFVVQDPESGARVLKVPSTPDDPSRAVENGLVTGIGQNDIKPSEVEFFSHASTVTTNALIESEGVKTGLLITEGFSAVYETRTQARPPGDEAKDITYQDPPMLVPQRRTKGIPQRMDETGAIIKPLDEAAAREAIQNLKTQGVDSIAVCFLFSFMNPEHEERVGELIEEEHPDCQVALSSEVLPQIREYPRLSTTVVDGYIGPTLSHYIRRLDDRVAETGIDTELFFMLSQGGLVPFESAAEQPVRSILSGPAAGVQGALYFSKMVDGTSNIITMDMGGTSCDTAVVKDGEIPRTREGSIEQQPVAVPMIDINTIGAGGGTIARVDAEGRLRVGPKSAGADPGPVCYGNGGTEPTVTDANVILGRLNPEFLLGGDLTLDAELAAEQMREEIAEPLGMTVEEASRGILQVVNENMKREMNLSFTRRGYDPSEFRLVAFGGGGPTQACRIAERLNIGEVLVPKYPGVNSAAGLLSTAIRHEAQTSAVELLKTRTGEGIESTFEKLEEEVTTQFAKEEFAADDVKISRQLDCRYEGQAYELTIDVAPETGVEALREQFDTTHEETYGRQSDEALEIVNYRVIGTVDVPNPQLDTLQEVDEPEPTDSRTVRHLRDGVAIETPIFQRDELVSGMEIEGPAIIEQMDTTTVIEPGQQARVDQYGNIIVATGVNTNE